MTTAPAGWRSDPTGRHEYRFWDGTDWTDEVADGGAVSADPLGQPGAGTGSSGGREGDHRFATPDGPPRLRPHVTPPETPPEDPPGLRSPGDDAPRPGPSTALLVGLSMLVVGLAAAIVLVLLTDDGNGDETTSTTTTTPGEDPETTTTGDDNQFQLDTAAEDMVTDFGGEISMEDARCMLREASQEGSNRGYTDESFEELQQADQLAVVNAMLTCVDGPNVVANLLAQGMVAQGAEEPAAQCAGDRIVENVAMDSLLLAIISDAQNPIMEDLTPQEQTAVEAAVVDCGVQTSGG